MAHAGSVAGLRRRRCRDVRARCLSKTVLRCRGPFYCTVSRCSEARPYTVSQCYQGHSRASLCDLLDEAAWRAANPALGIFRSEDALREQMKQAQRMPSMENTARNLLLNQRVSTESPFVSPDVWKACGRSPTTAFDGPVFAGLDLSMRTDLTALVIIGKVDWVWQG
mgnify:CR=1 FL=1